MKNPMIDTTKRTTKTTTQTVSTVSTGALAPSISFVAANAQQENRNRLNADRKRFMAASRTNEAATMRPRAFAMLTSPYHGSFSSNDDGISPAESALRAIWHRAEKKTPP